MAAAMCGKLKGVPGRRMEAERVRESEVAANRAGP